MSDADPRPRLHEIADELDRLAEHERALFNERLGLWKRAVELGIAKTELAHASRVKPITVRQLIKRSE